MTTACLIATDLSELRLMAEGVDDVWRAPEPEDPDNPPPLREVAAAAATWVTERLPGRRLDRVVFDVDEARCLWIATPSREPAVVAAAVRRRRADWGENDASGELVQPLVGESARGAGLQDMPLLRYLAPKRESGDGDGSAAVIEAPDAAMKLWLDALDARGVRVGDVASFWHMLARRSEGSRETLATVVGDRPGRVVWCWSENGNLVAGGLASMPHASTKEGSPDAEGAMAGPRWRPRPTTGRLALDWLTWSAQLGAGPDRVEVLAPREGGLLEALAEALAVAWPSAPPRSESADDPQRALIFDARAQSRSEPDARRSAPSLAERPSRPHRRVYRLAALAIVVAALGVALLGWKNQQAAAERREARNDLLQRGRQLVATIAPGYENTPDLAGSLRSFYVELREENPPLPLPPPPKPVFTELRRLLEAATPIEGVTVSRIEIDDARTSSAQFRIASYADGEELMQALTRTPGLIDWNERVTGSPPNIVQRLTGLWK